MEGDGTELTLEEDRLTIKACVVSTESINDQTNQQITLPAITLTKSSTHESHTSSDIKVTLENESVWSRFHSLGTEMILTKQGRRMFPCCRFRLSGLDLQTKYFLVMDIMPLDDFTHKWNGKTWEPVAMDAPHVLGHICVHPESPALGQQWMDSPVSFYKVKLTSELTDEEGCVLLRPMHRYRPRLHVVPVDPHSERIIALDSPNVKKFSFPETEFYAVTRYQNPQITQLKIDCNPFAMAFREDNQSISLLRDKLRFCSSIGKHYQSPLLSLARNLSGKRKVDTVKNIVSTCIQDKRIRESAPLKEGEKILTDMRNATLNCQNNVALCQENTDYSENDRENEAVVNKCPAEPVQHEHVAPLDFESTVSFEESLPSTAKPVPPINNTENLNSSEASEDSLNSQLSCTNNESPSESFMEAKSPHAQGEIKTAAVSPPRPPFLNGSQGNGHKPVLQTHYPRGRKAKSKWWSNVKYARPTSADVSHNVPLQTDLEDVEGMLFVSFVAKESLDTQNIKETETSLPPPSPTRDKSDHHEPEDISLSMKEKIAKLETILLRHLKQQKHRQVIHPSLQDVGMKLSLLNPKVPIDLQYLGVHLPLPSSIHEGLEKTNPLSLPLSPDAAGCFVSRTGKTNDLTKIKGWRDKYKSNTVQSIPEGLKNSSAFCSEMLDAYLENEAQQISDRVAVFSKSSTTPVSYQLPSKSSSYVVTLDSLLKTRSVSSNKVYSKSTDEILPNSALRSPRNSVPSAGFQHKFQENQEKERSACLFQAHQRVSTVQASRSKKQSGRSQVRWSSSPETVSHKRDVRRTTIPGKVKKQMMLKEMEEEAILCGKIRTHITTERAKFALTSLLNFQKLGKKPQFHVHHKDENACPEDYCLLGCICDSLNREIRGPTHCQRVECMFDCSCFKHKVFLLHPPKETANVQRGKRKSVLAFSIADPEREHRPPPATSITTLWKRSTGENDPEPLFIPVSSKTLSCLHNRLNRSSSQVQEEDKDPVYLYFESMMTCARVREYNSNPPPQIHMFPSKKELTEPEQLNESAKAGEPPSSQKIPEAQIKPGEPQPTKLLEILSECNWEPHRSSVLGALFRRMNSSLLSEPFCFGMYKIQLLSTTIKGVDRTSTITYKVSISRADEKEMTEDLQPPVKKTVNKKAGTDSGCKSRALVAKQRERPLHKKILKALSSSINIPHFGYLKADKKKPGSHVQSLIKVNGKTYAHAKLLLGQLGALHPVNRFAAFVTDKLPAILLDRHKVWCDATKACPAPAPLEPSSVTKVANVLHQTRLKPAVVRPLVASASKHNTVSNNRGLKNTPLCSFYNRVGSPPGTNPIVPDGSKFVLVPVTPYNSSSVPSAESITTTLPPGQQVVLHPAPGMSGSNFLCQYNGQMIQLKPISPGTLIQPQSGAVSKDSTLQVMQMAYNTCLPKDTRSLKNSLNPKPLPVVAPKVRFPLSAKSGMSIANGMPAFNLQSSFPGKTGTFSFRICPPTGQGKPAGSEQGDKPPEPSAGSSSTLVLPGGFTLIKLIQPTTPAVPANVTSAATYPAEIPQKDECLMESVSQSCCPSLEQKCPVSETIPKPHHPKTSNRNSAHGTTAGISPSSNAISSEAVIKDEPVEHFTESGHIDTPGKYNWVPEGAEMVHTSDGSESEFRDMDDWPPYGAERILWIDSDDEEENAGLNKNLDVAAGSPVAEAASELMTVKADCSSCNECLHAGKLDFNEKETSVAPNIYENGLPPEDVCSKHADEQKHLKSSMPNNDQEKVCDPVVNADNSSIENISQENCLSIIIKTEPCNEPTEMKMPGSESDIKNQGLLPDTNILHTSKVEMYSCQTGNNTVLDDFLITDQKLGSFNNSGVYSERELCSDSPKTDTCSVDDDISKEHVGSENILQCIKTKEPSKNQTVTEFFSDLSNHRLGSENSSQIVNHKEFYDNPAKLNTTASLQEDNDENVDIADNAPCSVMDGQTRMMYFPRQADLLNTASLGQTSGQKNISPSSHMQKSSPELSDDFENMSDNYNKTKENLKKGKNEVEDTNKWLKSKTAAAELCDEEDIDVDVINVSEDEDSSNGSNDDKKDSNSDEENSSNDSTYDSDTEDTSYDDGIESFEDNDGQKIMNIRDKFRNAKGAQKLKKKIKRLTSIISTAGYLPEHDLEKRLYNCEKERVRRDELRQSFSSLKKALNVEDRFKMCNHDILNQARIMISALEDRGHCLEKKKNALLRRQSAYQSKLIELFEITEDRNKASFEENGQLQAKVPGPQVNPRRLDSDGNRLPPCLGRWKAPNYIRKRSKKALLQPSITATVAADESFVSHLSPDATNNHTVIGPLPSLKTEDLVQTLSAHKSTGLPPICKIPQQEKSPNKPQADRKATIAEHCVAVLRQDRYHKAHALRKDISSKFCCSLELC